ncbi:MAG: hypothetical protein JWR72_4064 [Flavisolibacter sp.]|nr:hypothetical protein [Flavisolibacter sp.]
MQYMNYYFLLAALVFLGSCKKDSGEAKDTELPKILLTSPMGNQVFSGGQTISIEGTITDNKMLREIHLEITNTTTGTFLTHEHFAPNGSNYSLSKTFTLQAATTYKIKVHAEDESDNEAELILNISAN